MFQLTSKSINAQNLAKSLKSTQAGAFCAFEGWVRDHHQGKKVFALEYEAHKKLCQKEANKILTEMHQQFDTLQAGIVHRVGHLQVGEIAVWIGVSASHRDQAFKACRFLIDEIKQRLPIWKKEFYVTGDSNWVNGIENVIPLKSRNKKGK